MTTGVSGHTKLAKERMATPPHDLYWGLVFFSPSNIEENYYTC